MEHLTLTDARLRHPSEYIELIDRSDENGESRTAIYVWQSEQDSRDDDGSRAVAIYWAL